MPVVALHSGGVRVGFNGSCAISPTSLFEGTTDKGPLDPDNLAVEFHTIMLRHPLKAIRDIARIDYFDGCPVGRDIYDATNEALAVEANAPGRSMSVSNASDPQSCRAAVRMLVKPAIETVALVCHVASSIFPSLPSSPLLLTIFGDELYAGLVEGGANFLFRVI